MRGESPEDFRPKTIADLNEMALAYRADILADAFRGRIPTAVELANITEELGVEIATAVFLRTLQNAPILGEFARQARSFDFKDWDGQSVRAARVEVSVIASNLFQADRAWGDHVDEWRAWARDLGFTTEMIETDPRRSVAANARVIFEFLARSPSRPRIIVTYGQGAAEFRYLLHRRVNRDPQDLIPEEISMIRGWLNVCGAFSGSHSSRYFQENRVRRLLARLRMKVAGRNPIALAETSSTFPLWRRPIPTLPGLKIASLLGVPYAAQVPVTMQTMYRELAKHQPNDGAVTIGDAMAIPGFLVPVPGMSHRAPSALLEPMFKRTLAVLWQTIEAGHLKEGHASLPSENR